MRLTLHWIAAASWLLGAAALAGQTDPSGPPDSPDSAHDAGAVADSTFVLELSPGPTPAFTTVGGDTLRTNLWVAEALLGKVVADLLAELPPPPALILLVPATTEPAANLMTNIATNRLQSAGYTVYLDKVPSGTEEPVVELRYRVVAMELRYPETGRRLGIWKSWFSRQMDLSAQVTVVDRATGQVLSSRHVAHHFADRLPHGYQLAIESKSYPFTKAQLQASGWTRRLEEIVVLGALVGLVAVYFANTE